MNAVGIDVSKGKSMVAVMQPLGVVIAEPFEINHTESELGKLARFLKSLSGDTKVIMESTGHYNNQIADFLHDEGIFVTVVNPILIANYGANITVRKAKTDKKDSVKIANWGLEHWLNLVEYIPTDDIRKSLKIFNRQGWFYSHIKNIHLFAMCNASVISTDNLEKISLIAKNFETPWKNKVKQMQIPAFSINTKGTWVLKFDYIIADALELGPLRMEAVSLPIEFHSKVVMCDEKGLPFEAVRDVVCYYLANKTEDSEWVVLPVASFDCYYNSTIFSKKWLSRIPETIIKRESALGVCRVKLMLE